MHLKYLPVFLLLIPAANTFAQESHTYYPWQMDTVFVKPEAVSHFDFPADHRVVEQSVRVIVKQTELENFLQFRYESTANRILFFPPVPALDTVKISYQILPVLLRRQYSFFQLDTLFTEADTSDSIMIVGPLFENPFADVGGNLKRSGSIVRGVTIGSNKDMTLNSGLNLQTIRKSH